MAYTNGTLINHEVAKRLADIGNLTPCISVEGFEEKTDQRRGRGIFKRIMKSFEYLREEGVAFGISVEATKNNWDEVTSREFLHFYFDEQGAFYGWLFQYMPIGRSYTLKEMVTPEQRLEMFKRNVWAIKEGGYNYIDFWNQGVMTDGYWPRGGTAAISTSIGMETSCLAFLSLIMLTTYTRFTREGGISTISSIPPSSER
jgi:MoaA/NifB/PqqE/SkfB family radical SAM enzyme